MDAISAIVNDHNFIKLRAFGLHRLFTKIEGLNPAGSIKMKTALGLVASLEHKGLIGSQTILIESSSGSLGVALSIICAERGYQFTCVVDPNASTQNVRMMKALGATVITIHQRDANGGFLGSRIEHIKTVVQADARYLWLNQYANPENPRAHVNTTARAIFERFDRVDYLFVGAGTTGTLMGCRQFFGEHSPHTKIVAVDSVGSVTFGHPSGPRHIPGLGTSRRPEVFSPEGIHAFEMITETDTVAMCRYLARSNGFLAGGSTGTVLAAVHKWRDRIPPQATVVTISPDLGERYLDTVYCDTWVAGRFGGVPDDRVFDDLAADATVTVTA